MPDNYLERATPCRAQNAADQTPPNPAGFFIADAESDDLMRRRAAWIARRVMLSPTMAEVVASLHFSEAAQ